MTTEPSAYLTATGSTSPELGHIPAKRAEIYDVTLRDGEQQAGVVYSFEQKLAIFAALDAAGVPIVETGMAAASEEELRVARHVMESEHRARVFLLSRALESDVELAARAGVDGVALETLANPAVARKVFGWRPEERADRARRAVAAAKERGLSVNLFFVDATRIGASELAELAAEACSDVRPDTVTVADTFGVANGRAMAAYVEAVLAAVERPVHVHCHNEYGLAVANTCAGLEAGASGAHTSVNGMGERAGNAALEDVVMAGTGPHRWETGVDPASLRELSRLVADLSGIEPAPNKSVVGRELFAIESGVAAAFYEALGEKELGEFYAYTPDVLRGTVRVLVGKGSGAANLRLKARELQCDDLRDHAVNLVPLAKERAVRKLGDLSDAEVLDLLHA